MQRTSVHKISSQKSYFNLRLDIKQVIIPNKQQSSVKIVHYSTCSSDMYTRIENTVFSKSAFQLCFLQKKSIVIFTASQSSSTFQLSIENQNQSNHNYWSEQKLTMIINQWGLKLETSNLLKAREMRVTKSWLALISHLIANCDTSFLDQSHNEVWLNKSNLAALRYSVGNCSNKVSW